MGRFLLLLIPQSTAERLRNDAALYVTVGCLATTLSLGFALLEALTMPNVMPGYYALALPGMGGYLVSFGAAGFLQERRRALAGALYLNGILCISVSIVAVGYDLYGFVGAAVLLAVLVAGVLVTTARNIRRSQRS